MESSVTITTSRIIKSAVASFGMESNYPSSFKTRSLNKLAIAANAENRPLTLLHVTTRYAVSRKKLIFEDASAYGMAR